MHVEDLLKHHGGEPDYGVRMYTIGRVVGLRVALCVLKGWDPVGESDKEGRADEYLKEWHNIPGHCTEEDCGSW